MYTEVWQDVHDPGTRPPAPIVSGNFFVDESADRAEELGQKHLALTMRAAVKNYALDTKGLFPTIKGYENYEKMTLTPEEIGPYACGP